MTPEQPRPITRVRMGMTVIDRHGDAVGTVDLIRMGDPGAVTSDGQASTSTDPFAAVTAALTGGEEPRVPRPAAERLIRVGYIKIDRPGPTDAYAAADEVAEVDGSEVRLNRPAVDLLAEV